MVCGVFFSFVVGQRQGRGSPARVQAHRPLTVRSCHALPVATGPVVNYLAAMRKTLFLFVLTVVAPYALAQSVSLPRTFTLSSSSVGGQATDQEVFNGFGCTGKNISPQLSWTNAPEGTKSFAVTMFDPDAPTGSGWWHWLVFDIPATATGLVGGAGTSGMPGLPAGAIQGRTDFGAAGYGGPCPPPGHGPHQYVLTVHALKTEKLGLDPNASSAVVGYTLNSQRLAKASIIFYYER